jgi:uncharacterized membrane protein YhiD involved in acid resistance
MNTNSNNLLPDNNRTWILGGAGVVVTIMLSLGGIIANNLQSQIDRNQERIYHINSTAVTDERLDRQIKQVTDYIDVRIQSLESQQREMSRQITILVEDTREFRREFRESISEAQSR